MNGKIPYNNQIDVLCSIGAIIVGALLYEGIGFIITEDPIILAIERALSITIIGLGLMYNQWSSAKAIVYSLEEEDANTS